MYRKPQMKKFFLLLILCNTINVKADYWTQKAAFPGTLREGPICFVIGEKGYVGCGYTGFGNMVNDFWEYDRLANNWTQKANFGGIARCYGAGFSINGKGYGGFGMNTNYVSIADLWEYNPLTDSWASKAYFNGGGRHYPCAVAANGKGYLTTGSVFSGGPISFFNDLWEYDPVTDTWTQKNNLPGLAREAAAAFSIGNKIYIGTGTDGLFLNDFWEYDISTAAWTQKTNVPGGLRADGCGFSIGNFGYIGFGEITGSTTFVNDFWQYNPALNSWMQKTGLPASGRDEPAFFAITNKGYVGLGGAGGINMFNDFWEYTPDTASGINEFELSNADIHISPNPAKEEFMIYGLPVTVNKTYELKVFDSNGKVVLTKLIAIDNRQLSTVNCKLLPTGIYFVQVSDGENRVVKKLLLL